MKVLTLPSYVVSYARLLKILIAAIIVNVNINGTLPLTDTVKRVTYSRVMRSASLIKQLNSPSSNNSISDNVNLDDVKYVTRRSKEQLNVLDVIVPCLMYIRAQSCGPIFHFTSDNCHNSLSCLHVKVASSD